MAATFFFSASQKGFTKFKFDQIKLFFLFFWAVFLFDWFAVDQRCFSSSTQGSRLGVMRLC